MLEKVYIVLTFNRLNNLDSMIYPHTHNPRIYVYVVVFSLIVGREEVGEVKLVALKKVYIFFFSHPPTHTIATDKQLCTHPT